VIKASAAPCARGIYQTAAHATRTLSASRGCVIATSARIFRASVMAKPASQFRLLSNEPVAAGIHVAGTFVSMAAAGPAYPTRNAGTGRAATARATTGLDCLGTVAADSSRLVPIPPIDALPFCPRILPSRRSAPSVHPSPLAHPVRPQQAPVPTRPPTPTVRRDSAQAIRIAPRDSVISAPVAPCAGGISIMATNAKGTIIAGRCCAIAASARRLEGRGTAITASHASPCRLLHDDPGAPTMYVAGTYASRATAGPA
jgi:hypothetical protein